MDFTLEELDIALTEESARRTLEASSVNESSDLEVVPRTPDSSQNENEPASAPNEPHEDGIFIVGGEISPGLWRSTSADQRFCYWARRKYDGILLGSYYGLPGIEMRIFASDYEVEFDGCGTWIFMGDS